MPYLSRDGVSLFYEEAGGGEPALLLVHGWCCDHTYLAPQFAHFRQRHRVVTVDLRGHGQSDQPEQEYPPTVFAEDLAWLCDQLAIARPVVIGHSLGGVVAVEFAGRYLERTAAVVAIDSPLAPNPGFAASRQAMVTALRGPDYREAARRFIEGMFVPTDDPERKARIIDEMCGAAQHVMASAMEQIVAWDRPAALAKAQAPLLNLCARGVLAFAPYADQYPHITHAQTVGTGHFSQLEAPEQVNAMIARFLAVSLPVAAR